MSWAPGSLIRAVAVIGPSRCPSWLLRKPETPPSCSSPSWPRTSSASVTPIAARAPAPTAMIAPQWLAIAAIVWLVRCWSHFGCARVSLAELVRAIERS
jgi:hypothetical protein